MRHPENPYEVMLQLMGCNLMPKSDKLLSEDVWDGTVHHKVKEVIDKGNYELRVEMVSMFHEDKPMEIISCYSKKDGSYIGDEKTAKFICDKMGIVPEKAAPDHNVCSIGFCDKKQKFYGWSHRAISGFGIGDEPLAATPAGNETEYKGPAKTLEDAKRYAIEFAASVS